jgi:hypothetical protein
MMSIRRSLAHVLGLAAVTALALALHGCAFTSLGGRVGDARSVGGVEALSPPPFQESRAIRDLMRIASLGPRVPGTGAHEHARAYVAQILMHHGFVVREDPFEWLDESKGPVAMANLVALRQGTTEGRGTPVLLVTHYDTRPVSDMEKSPARRALPVPGANDGASGVAVLLEVARQVAKDPDRYPPLTLALVDGEDWPTAWRPDPSGVALAGSQRLAAGIGAGEYGYALVLDMVGDSDLRLRPEAHSIESSAGLTERVWRTGSTLAPEAFRPGPGPRLVDDHLPLMAAGVPTCLLIDFDYRPWHTLADTEDKVSAASLGAVGRTVLAVLRRPVQAQ